MYTFKVFLALLAVILHTVSATDTKPLPDGVLAHHTTQPSQLANATPGDTRVSLVFPGNNTSYTPMYLAAFPIMFEIARPDLAALVQMQVHYTLTDLGADPTNSTIDKQMVLDRALSAGNNTGHHGTRNATSLDDGSDLRLSNATLHRTHYVPVLAKPTTMQGAYRLDVETSYVVVEETTVNSTAVARPRAERVEHAMYFQLQPTGGQDVLVSTPTGQTCGAVSMSYVVPVQNETVMEGVHYGVLDPDNLPHDDREGACTMVIHADSLMSIAIAAFLVYVEDETSAASSVGAAHAVAVAVAVVVLVAMWL